ncbi:MAG TPA: formate--tetrahydrofolate ligase [Candidatus Sumerlaeota bacterium]|nr:formate--tetrahydrofolate ligase [Candidatus Sumerlaeota bacterium]
MKSDIEISQSAKIEPIQTVCARYGIEEQYLDPYGRHKAKLSLDLLKNREPRGKYILVTAITPTPLGEGKTVTTVGLSMALNRLGRSAVCAIRQPSLGPTFGIKGGAAGGGYVQVVPMEEFNLHLTGDIHAVSIAHNLCAAYIDNALFHKNSLNLDPHSILWRRVVDVSDRALRDVIVGLGGKANGHPRQTGFDIAVASEAMAVLALASDLQDLRKRLGRIVIGTNQAGQPVTADDLQCAGAMAAIMVETIKPTVMQTLEGTLALVHAGPFANIAHGNSSILADQIGLRFFDYVVTESGFGADIGAEKFFNIKCRTSGLKPAAAVLVCTVRALKAHSGKFRIVPGKPLPDGLVQEDLESLRAGLPNLQKQIENVHKHGIPVVVAINRFPSDTEAELAAIKEAARGFGVEAAVHHEMHARGGEGGRELAEAVVRAAEMSGEFKLLYPDEMPVEEKIETIVREIYGGDGVEILPQAQAQIAQYKKWGFGHLPICMAKTHLSLSHEPKLMGRPTGFRVPVREVRLSAGAGFLYALCGTMMTMPGLPAEPAGNRVDIDANGRIVGLF